MAEPTDPGGVAIPSAQSDNRSDELIGALVALRPVGEETTLETSVGLNAARWVEALIIGGSPGEYVNLGEVPIFWQVIRRQLNDARPWVVGYVVQRGRAYRLTPPNREEIAIAMETIKLHLRDPKPVKGSEEDPTGAAVPDEAPY